ncbi:MAG: succinylglutamate desuccinylase/aspartoacylase family protein [Planctomycetota bacterium]|nr:succinylglutamate desuccinylase/aspartoacylase family protein [Planctomycetota bacterium]
MRHETASLGGAGGGPSAPGLPSREVGRYDCGLTGPLFLTVGGLHGNEPAGITASQRVLAGLENAGIKLRGRYVALRGNLAALAADQRFVERDLNRIWTPADLDGLQNRIAEEDGPDEGELRELLNAFQRLFLEPCGAGHCAEVVLLDLHSTSGPSTPFLCMADTLQNRRVAFALGVPVILGLEEALEGTLLDFMSEAGHVAIAFEGGAHDGPDTIDSHEAAIWQGLVAAGLLDARDVPELERHRGVLEHACHGAPAIVEVRHRQGTRPGDGFRMDPDWANFQPVERGQVVAQNLTGEIHAPITGRLLLPRYQDQGDDGFFITRDVRPFWLRLSAKLRRSGLGALLPYLPGVKRVAGDPRRLRIDRRKARFAVRQLFHLFGFRRFREDEWGYEFLRRPDR